ncbi:MAG: RNA polymerase sigma factor [Planctomycetota bacterium]|nr:RNA polymerase sigma factor [Planctomycetota bacterium]MDA1162806.1 RNA polymerase sigma factor [Planctomycetota bacterium]
MECVQSGQLNLFDELVRRHQASMLRAAVSKLRNQAVAEEAVQEAFLSAYAYRHSFRSEYSFRGWLWTILLNTCRTLARRESGRVDRVGRQSDLSESSEPFSSGDALSRLLQSEQADLLYRCLNELPEAQADALRLRFFGGLKFDEIAHAMSCSTNGAKQRVRTGLEKLSASLQRVEISTSNAKETPRHRGSQGEIE